MFTLHGPDVEAELAYRRETLLREGRRLPGEATWRRRLRRVTPRGRR